MNWQEEEIQKRNATNVRTDGLENIAQTNSNIAIKKGNELWDMFIQKNKQLLPDIRLIEHTENGEIVSLKKMSDMNCKQLEYRHDTIFVTGDKYKCRRFTISYHASKGSFIGYLNNITSENSDPTSKYDANTAQFYIDSNSVEIILRYICTSYPFLNDLRMINYQDPYCSSLWEPFQYARRKRALLNE